MIPRSPTPRAPVPPGFGPGFTVIEVMASVGLLTIGFLGLATGIVANSRAYEGAREDAQAIHALRKMAETIRGTAFAEVAVRWTGYGFVVPEIGATGTVTVFVNETDSSTEARKLGLPRDLDGDGAATRTNVSASYQLLPLKVEVTWNGRQGPKSESLHFLLAEERN